MNIKKWLLFYLMFFSLTLLAACEEQGPSEMQVEKIGTQYFEAIKNKNFDQAVNLYAEEIFATRSRDQWHADLETNAKTMGDLQRYELKNAQSDTRFSGKFYILEYKTFYTKDIAWEILTMVNPVNSNEIKLLGHKIKARGLKNDN